MWLTNKKSEWRLYFDKYCTGRFVVLKDRDIPIELKTDYDFEEPLEVTLVDRDIKEDNERELKKLRKENNRLREELHEHKMNDGDSYRYRKYEPFNGCKVDRDTGCWSEEYEEYLATHDDHGYRYFR